jgi:hypothetical protein
MAKRKGRDWRTPRRCENCRAEFIPVRKRQRFHIEACRTAAWRKKRVHVYVTPAEARRLKR